MSHPEDVRLADAVEGAVSLIDVAKAVWKNKWLIAVTTILAAALTLGVSYFMTPKYRAQAVVVPVTADLSSGGGVASLVRGLGGLASLAGIGLGGESNRDEILEYLRSRSFTTAFIQENDLLPVLFHEQWDANKQQWNVPLDEVPTLGDAYEFFTEDVRSISDDKKTGIARVTITWSDPELAAQWANALVASANARLRQRAIQESERSIEYLRREGDRTTVVAVKEAIAKLTEEQVKSVMLANVRDDFALRVIDPAAIPEPDDIVSPRRAVMAVVGALAGFCLGLLLALARDRLAAGR